MWIQATIFFALGVVTQLHASEQVLYAAAPSERGAFHVGGGSGTYNYGYNTGDGIAKIEVRRPDGSVVGSYRYFDASGKQIVRSYIADKNGFRVLGNDLPISPNTQAVAIDGLPAFTAPVEGDTNSKYSKINTINNEINTVSDNTQYNKPQNTYTNDQYSLINEHAAALKRQQDLIRKQEAQLEKLKGQLKQYKQKVKPQKLQKPLYSQSIPNAVSPYLLLPNQVNYGFPAGFAVEQQVVVQDPIAVQGEHEFMADYAAGHLPSAGHIHEPVGPKLEFHEYDNQVTAGHTRSRFDRRGRYIIGHARK